MIQENLKKLGFSDKEAEIYLTILEQGKTMPARISASTGINRTTVYSVIKGLLRKGVISEDITQKNHYLIALSAENLERLTMREEVNLKNKKNLISKTIEEIEAMPFGNQQYSIPKIKFLEEDDLENHLYTQLKTWDKSCQKIDGTCWGFQDHSFAEKYKKWILWAGEKFPQMQVNLLSNKSEIEEKMKGKIDEVRHIKFWTKNANFTSSTWILGDYLIMIVTDKKPNYLVEIHDAMLAHNMREVFKKIWKDAEK
jgi:sugar-specific transcriptional regulator TrmB